MKLWYIYPKLSFNWCLYRHEISTRKKCETVFQVIREKPRPTVQVSFNKASHLPDYWCCVLVQEFCEDVATTKTGEFSFGLYDLNYDVFGQHVEKAIQLVSRGVPFRDAYKQVVTRSS